MALTTDEARRARSLLKKAGVPTSALRRLQAKYPELAKRSGGAPKKGNDEAVLEGIEYAVRLIMRVTGKKRKPAIVFFANSIYAEGLKDSKGRPIAKSPKTLAKRWEDKLRKGGLHRRADSSLAPRGVLFPLLKSRTVSLPYPLPDEFFR
jgi:hypothetical protein